TSCGTTERSSSSGRSRRSPSRPATASSSRRPAAADTARLERPRATSADELLAVERRHFAHREPRAAELEIVGPEAAGSRDRDADANHDRFRTARDDAHEVGLGLMPTREDAARVELRELRANLLRVTVGGAGLA